MKVNLINDLLEKLKIPAQRTRLLLRIYHRGETLYNGVANFRGAVLQRLEKLSLSFSILERLQSYLMTELSVNPHETDTYTRLGRLIVRLDEIGGLLLRLYPLNPFLSLVPIPWSSHPTFFPREYHRPGPVHETKLCREFSDFFPRASEAYHRAVNDYTIDPSITPREVDEIESYVNRAHGILSEFLLPTRNPSASS